MFNFQKVQNLVRDFTLFCFVLLLFLFFYASVNLVYWADFIASCT